ncbi:MAG: DUF1501 domain-containing protein [Proteobacteria bacterium]|nr:DUF1501 domain-containing protein [Pseudomonadota bacterium]
MNLPHPTRRSVLAGGLALGGAACWASPMGWGVPQPERPRLVVLALEGGADGLSLAPPVGDGAYHGLRGKLAVRDPLRFDADFGLHPELKQLAGMAEAGEVRLAPAAASPSLSRSHFWEQDVLQSGLADPKAMQSGWLNRAVAHMGTEARVQAVTLDAAAMRATAGEVAFASPSAGLDANMAWRLKELYRNEPELLRLVEVSQAAQELASRGHAGAASGEPGEVVNARKAGRLLASPDGPSTVYLTLGGFDTHENQGADGGQLAGRLHLVDAVLGALKTESGPAWAQTAVIVFTEFGRTVRPNGDGGTDHGAAGTALLLGGAVKAGGLLGDWPTLARLHDGRDLRPGLDLRSLFKGVLHEHWGLPKRLLETEIFPDSASAPLLTGLARG